MTSNERILSILKQAKEFYFATVDGDAPMLRPFNAIAEFDGELYFYTNNHKGAYRQMCKNPNVSICAEIGDDRWIRISGKAVFDESIEAKRAMLESNPELKKIYKEDDKIFEVFYLIDVSAVIHCDYQEQEVIC